MARPRIELQTLLEATLGSDHVYFQPPESVRMRYPAIVYERDRTYDIFADNGHYIRYKGYLITHIGQNPDSSVLDLLETLPMCSYVRHYETQGLNHDVFVIYF